MGGAATARERQAALRDRRRKDGLNYIHVWANADQEQAIKAFLADPAANPLHVTVDPVESDEVIRLRFDLVQQRAELQQRIHEVAEKEIKLEAQRRAQDAYDAEEDRLVRREEESEATYQKYKAWADEAKQRLEAVYQRERDLDQQERQLKSAGARLQKDRESNAVTDKARTEALIQRFTTERDYRANGVVYKPIVDDYRIEQRAKEISKLTTRTKTVNTSLATLMREFKDLLGDKETADLEDAMRILNRISNAAGTAQKKTRALEAKIKEEEKQRHIMAYKAATARLEGLPDADKVLILCTLDPKDFDLQRLLYQHRDAPRAGAPRVLRATQALREVEESAHNNIRNRIKDHLKAGQGLDQALTSLNDLISKRMPEAQDTYGYRIQEAIAEVVAERLAKANGV